jgi:lariat debranching enzyme
MLIEILRPQLVLCGHMHFRAETIYKLEDGRDCQIVALANLLQGESSLAVFAVDGDGLIRRIDGGK